MNFLASFFLSLLLAGQVIQPPSTNIGGGISSPSGSAFTNIVYCPIAAGVVTTGSSQTTAACNTTGAKLLVVGIATILGTNTYTLSSSPANTWTCAVATVVPSNGSSQICYVINPTVSNTQTFSVLSVGATSRVSVGVAAYADTGTPTIDGSVVGGTSGAGVAVQPGSITPVGPNELLFTVYSGNGVGGTAATIDSSFTVRSTNTASLDSAYGDQIQTTATARNPTWTGSDTQSSAQMVAFKP